MNVPPVAIARLVLLCAPHSFTGRSTGAYIFPHLSARLRARSTISDSFNVGGTGDAIGLRGCLEILSGE